MEREISLREIIEVILKGKWLIISVTIASLVVAMVYTVFLTKTLYEARSLIYIQGVNTSGDESLQSIEPFKESLASAVTLDEIIEKNQLDRSKYTVAELRKMYRLDLSKDNNLIKLTVKGQNPSEIANLANILASELGVIIEVSDRSQVIGESEARLKSLSEEILVTKSKVTEMQKQLNNIDKIETTKQSVLNNDILRMLIEENSNSSVSSGAGLEMTSEELNPAYIDLQKNLAEIFVVLDSLATEEAVKKQVVDENKSRIIEIQKETVKDKFKDGRTITINSNKHVVMISQALQPETPLDTQKLLVLVLAAALGIIGSVLLVFLRNYLRNTPRSGINA